MFQKVYEHADLRVFKVVGGPFQVNTYLLEDILTRDCAVIDPGMDDGEAFYDELVSLGLNLRFALITHAHVDHISQLSVFNEHVRDLCVVIHRDSQPFVDGYESQCRFFGFSIGKRPEIGAYTSSEGTVVLGSHEIRSVLTPGHCPGHFCYYLSAHDLLFTGDLLFYRSIGRTDFQGGDVEQMQDSLQHILTKFEDETLVYPGHGRATTIGEERKNNPFLRLS